MKQQRKLSRTESRWHFSSSSKSSPSVQKRTVGGLFSSVCIRVILVNACVQIRVNFFYMLSG